MDLRIKHEKKTSRLDIENTKSRAFELVLADVLNYFLSFPILFTKPMSPDDEYRAYSSKRHRC